ncbi:MAG TPA: DegV family protein [Chloroflexia bacterium]|nr:DegV family protein [Chloroflexia bacterium]
MPMIRVVTDSTCDLPDPLVRQHNIVVIPVSIHLGSETYLDRVNLTTEALLRQLPGSAPPPTTAPPAAMAFEQVYRQLQANRPCDGIVSVHLSARLSGTAGLALLARDSFVNTSFPVGVVDSESASMGLGLIVLAAARQATAGGTWPEVMQAAQRARGQTHVAFFVDSIEGLYRGKRIPRLAAGIEALLPLKPLLRLDEGQIILLERTRTRHKALDSLCSFVEDFPHVEELVLLHNSPPNEIESLLNRLSVVCPRDRIGVVPYGPANAVYLGPGAVGVAVYEGA